MEIILSLFIGIGLSAACGFRVFVPLLIASLATMTGHLHVGSSFEWLGTIPALTALSVATALEVLAYFIPFVDNLLDHATGPASVIAGTLLTASMGYELDPFLKWSFAIVAGGGSAAVVHTATSLTRLASSATTVGTGNSILAIAELVGAIVTSVLSIFVPFLAVFAILIISFILIKRFRKKEAI
ncbi:MAG: DUF4126 domain-containing protein [Candidatus Sericytochromatia bacterium]